MVPDVSASITNAAGTHSGTTDGWSRGHFRPVFVSSTSKEQSLKKGGGEHSNGRANCQLDNVLPCLGMEREPIVVYTAQGEFEETQVRSFLSAHDIATTTRGEALRKTHGLTLDGLGEVEILVAPEDAEEARRLLDEAERGEFTLGDSVEP